MATNFEFYKDEILEIARLDLTPVFTKKGEIRDCNGTKCDDCAFGCGECRRKRYEWLYAEHIEQPKLTKRERAFCEAVQTGWIARDKDQKLYWFPADGEIQKGEQMWHGKRPVDVTCMGVLFIFVKWEDEKPWSVESLMQLEVKEDE